MILKIKVMMMGIWVDQEEIATPRDASFTSLALCPLLAAGGTNFPSPESKHAS